ncbi:VQ domain-containing protein [Cephalotus follicularis]|uniref:VQ domain-containing protein n=1 Tax=Cephalotus follicularis TaxID=3775 RepID=A0A1Q3BFQ5_CEPFO|nr:VQ domain-containing protein [Cephalotus follicularis]
MGKLRDNQYHHDHKSQKLTKVKKNDPIKVTHISSPMLVKASNPSEFRAIVQELTGQYSNINDFGDLYATSNTYEEANQVSYHKAPPQANIDTENSDTISSSISPLEFNQGFVWGDDSESFFGLQSSYL